jgi:glycosyltransferase involved in cell wall biosynthesis
VEEVHPNRLLMAMLKLADGAWVYMEKETVQWKAIFPDKAIVALNNTISGVEKVLDTHYDVDELKGIKKKHNITEDILLIYCARFDNPYRRFDLLIQTIELLDPRKYGFIIIGEGAYKPDFLPYKNVYDYGKVYEKQLKDELFSIADIYYQPGWIGLSVVEAMAYGKPILTFKRSEAVLQCVEYHYIEHDRNGILLNNIEELKETLSKLMQRELIAMGMQSKRIVQDKLLMGNMVQNALSIL